MLEASGQGYLLAEAYRCQGVLLLQAVPETAQAEACFQQALAHRQQAKSWELRVATSLSRLWQRRRSAPRRRHCWQRYTTSAPKTLTRQTGVRPGGCWQTSATCVN